MEVAHSLFEDSSADIYSGRKLCSFEYAGDVVSTRVSSEFLAIGLAGSVVL